MKTLSFLAYSDIHYHHYTNGLTLQDVYNVESQILDLAIAKKVDFILFGGDRFMSRNPMYEAGFLSDTMLKKISDSGIPLYILVGNHDRLTKNDFKMHTMSHISKYAKDLPNVVVMDQQKTYRFRLKDRTSVAISALPAGHEPIGLAAEPDADFNICVFHAIILGSLYHNGTLASGGLSVTSFDKKGFDLVLAGDNHKNQPLPGMTTTPGYYIGAPMQHNWGDEGAVRGCLYVKLTSAVGDTNKRHVACGIDWIVTKHPKFMHVDWTTDSLEKLIFAAEHGVSDWADNIVKLNISGPSDVLNSINPDDWKTRLVGTSGARTVEIKLKYTTTATVAPVTVGPVSDADEWLNFLATKSSDLDKVDVAYLEKLGMKYINNV